MSERARTDELEKAREFLREKSITIGDSVVFDKVDTCIYQGLYANTHGVTAMVRFDYFGDLDYKGADELHSVHYSRLTKLL